MLSFSERTVTVSIDTGRCPECVSKACVAACHKYARGILELKDGIPSVAHLDAEGVKRGGTECLACEYECWFRGRQAISIDVPIKGLPEYLAKRGLPQTGAPSVRGRVRPAQRIPRNRRVPRRGRRTVVAMGILIDRNVKVMVQGITGREGSLRAQFMKDYGTRVVAGTSPGKSGDQVCGIPVYDTVEEAIAAQGQVDFSVIFVPGRTLLPAVKEAADAGVPNLVACVESVPIQDIMVMVEYCRERGTRLLGPGTIGMITPGEAVVGWLGGSVEWANTFFAPGPIGVFSRSGGQSGTIPWVLSRAGFGVSTVVHTGTEPVIGTSMADLLPLFEADPKTKAVAVFSEIGGSQEEECAEVIASGGFTKPFVIFVAGSWAPEGQRFSHASSIVERGRGSAKSKMEAIEKAGGYVAESPNDIPRILTELL